MRKILIYVLAIILVLAGSFFGFDQYFKNQVNAYISNLQTTLAAQKMELSYDSVEYDLLEKEVSFHNLKLNRNGQNFLQIEEFENEGVKFAKGKFAGAENVTLKNIVAWTDENNSIDVGSINFTYTYDPESTIHTLNNFHPQKEDSSHIQEIKISNPQLLGGDDFGTDIWLTAQTTDHTPEKEKVNIVARARLERYQSKNMTVIKNLLIESNFSADKITVAKIAARNDNNIPPTSSELAITELTLPAITFGNHENPLPFYGYEKLVMDLYSGYQLDVENKKLQSSIALSIKDVAAMSLKTIASNINIEKQPENPSTLMNTNIDFVELRLQDKSFIKRFIETEATQTNKKPEEVTKEYTDLIDDMVKEVKKPNAGLTQLGEGIKALINNGQEITITLQPETPLNVGVLFAGLMLNPTETLVKMNPRTTIKADPSPAQKAE